MKKYFLLFLAILSLGMLHAQDHMTPELLWKLGRVSGHRVSPDGRQILFGISYYKLEDNKGNRDLYLLSSKGGKAFRLTASEHSEFNECWRPDGKKIAFLAASNDGAQLFEMNPDGSEITQLSRIEGGISNFAYAPDMKHVYFTRDVKMGQTLQERYPDLPKAEARIIDDLMYRHWDHWEDEYKSHLFVADYEDGKIGAMKDIMEGEPYDTPLMPFGGSSQIAWSPDGSKIAYTCKKMTGREYSLSTNSEIYLYDLQSGETLNISKGLPGYDMEPVFSPSGRYLVWQSMERAGFESDRQRLIVHDFHSGQRFELSEGLDRDAIAARWSADEKTVYFISGEKATYQVFSIDLESRKLRQITHGDYNYRSFALLPDGHLVASRQDMNHPTELFLISSTNGDATQLTAVNASIYAGLKTGKIEKRWIKTTDGKEMLTWIIFPPDFDPSKKYPTLLYCQGGPQSAVSQFFSYRWNFQLMAANGYIIVAPNRRGLPSFGREWNDEISGDWGGQAMLDYLSAIDEMAKESYVDNERLGAIGASFGGYSVYWLAGHHDGRFKSFVAHCGVFNLESMYLSTEEMWFVNWDMGGPYWDPAVKAKYEAFSPHNFIQNWDTPILVIHGQRDFRVPVEQGMQAFNGARLLDIKSRFLYFPDEGHWVLSPQNGVLWHREFFRWLGETLK